MEGRNIIDNIYLTQDALAWAEENNQNLVFLFE
jgi:hypothetical protein